MPSLTARAFAALTTVPLTVLGLTAVAPPSLANGGCGETFSGGSGTSADPYLISSAADFTALNGDSDCWAGEFLQTANIDMSGVEWNATTGTSAYPFSGTYDGGNFTISNLEIYVSGNHAGLFGYVTGTIRNIRFDTALPVYVGFDYVGGLVGYLDGGTISNSSSTAPVEADDGYAGGLVGYAATGSSIDASHATGSVVADASSAYAGGLVGENFGSIRDSYATGTVEGGSDDDKIGGLIGSNYGSVTHSYATGNVLNEGGEAVGGLVGENGGTVAHSYATGNVGHASGDDPGDDIGGLIGLQETDGVVTNSYATGSVIGNDYVGGLMGRATSGSLASGVYATGVVTGGSTADVYVGGLLGLNKGTLTNCYASGDVQDGGDAGGLVGVNSSSGIVSNCYSLGTVSGDAEGGLVAVNSGSVTNSFWDTVTSDETSSAGGTGKTTSELKTLETFTSAGWSITKGWSSSSPPTWGICAQMNNGYPFLNWSADVNPCGDGPFAEFTFSLPTGEECTSISPMRATIGQQTRLPGADADCATMPGSKIIGWTIPVPANFTGAGSSSLPFSPGHLVDASNSQQFTAVLWEPVIEFRYDANVGASVTCEPGDATHTSNNGHLAHIWVPREDFTDARFPTTTPCTPPGHELQAWNTAGNGTGQDYTPGNPLPQTWVSDNGNTHTFYAAWRRS